MEGNFKLLVITKFSKWKVEFMYWSKYSCFLCPKPARIRGAEARGGELGLKLNITQRESAKLVSPRRGFK